MEISNRLSSYQPSTQVVVGLELLGYISPEHIGQGTDEVLETLLHKAWPAFRSLHLPARDLLAVYCHRVWNTLELHPQCSQRVQKTRVLKKISQELNTAFASLNEPQAKAARELARLAFADVLELLGRISSSLKNAASLREIIECVLHCLENSPELLNAARGKATSLEDHRPFLKALLSMTIQQLEKESWPYPPLPDSKLLISVIQKNEEIKQKVLRQAYALSDLLDNPTADREALSKILYAEGAFDKQPRDLLISLEQFADFQKIKLPCHDYQLAFGLYSYYFPNRASSCLESILIGNYITIDKLSTDDCERILAIIENLGKNVNDLVREMLYHTNAEQIRDYIQELIWCLKMVQGARVEGEEDIRKLKDLAHPRNGVSSEAESQLLMSICQRLMESFNTTSFAVRKLPNIIRASNDKGGLDSDLCLIMTHAFCLVDYSLRSTMESLMRLISTAPAIQKEPTPALCGPLLESGKKQKQRRLKKVEERGVEPAPQRTDSLALSDPTPETVSSVDATQGQLTRRSSQIAHKNQALHRLYSRRLGMVRTALTEMEGDENSPKQLAEHKRQMFHKIGRCQQLLESILIRSLVENECETGCLDILESVPTHGTWSPRFRHSLVDLAKPLYAALQLKEILQRHKLLLRTLDRAHSVVFYLERSCASGHIAPGEGSLLALLNSIDRAKTLEELQQDALVVNTLVTESCQCAEELQRRSRLDSFSPPPKSETALDSIDEEKDSPTIGLSVENRLPRTSSVPEARMRIQWCRQLLNLAKELPAAPGTAQQKRREERNQTLAHVDRYLTWLQSMLSQKPQAPVERPLTLTLESLDAIHRALKEIVIAALLHQPAYTNGRHLVESPARRGEQRPLLLDNDVCATFCVLFRYHEHAGHEGVLRCLPPQFTERLSWLRGIHDQLGNPGRKVYCKSDVSRHVSKIQKLTMQRRRLKEKHLEPGWMLKLKDKQIDPLSIDKALKEHGERLFQKGLFPALDAFYLILRCAFQCNEGPN